jgi:hypothetical protein
VSRPPLALRSARCRPAGGPAAAAVATASTRSLTSCRRRRPRSTTTSTSTLHARTLRGWSPTHGELSAGGARRTRSRPHQPRARAHRRGRAGSRRPRRSRSRRYLGYRDRHAGTADPKRMGRLRSPTRDLLRDRKARGAKTVGPRSSRIVRPAGWAQPCSRLRRTTIECRPPPASAARPPSSESRGMNLVHGKGRAFCKPLILLACWVVESDRWALVDMASTPWTGSLGSSGHGTRDFSALGMSCGPDRLTGRAATRRLPPTHLCRIAQTTKSRSFRLASHH